MSRTYRRKNFIQENNSSWDRKYKKVIGTYVDYHCEFVDTGIVKDGYHHRTLVYTYYPATGRELWRQKRYAHADSSTGNSRSPGRFWRQSVNHEMKTHNNREFQHWLDSCGDYDPVFQSKARSCWWDWD